MCLRASRALSFTILLLVAREAGAGSLRVSRPDSATPSDSVNTLDCTRPLQGDLCLLLTCGGGAFSTAGVPTPFDCVLTEDQIRQLTGGYGNCTIRDVNVAFDLNLTQTSSRWGTVDFSKDHGADQQIWGQQFPVTCAASPTAIDEIVDDEASGFSSCATPGSTEQPYFGSSLSVFDGERADGIWTLSPSVEGSGNLLGFGVAADVQCATKPNVTCTPSGTVACLHGQRFKVSMTYQAGTAPKGDGTAAKFTDDTGWFWFFSPANVEAVVKIVDGCGFNQHYWVFAAGLTNVNVVITVEDTLTHAVMTYTNPKGTAFKPIQDTSAFATCP